MRPVLIVGGSGLIGRATVRRLGQTRPVFATHHTRAFPSGLPYDLERGRPEDLDVPWSSLSHLLICAGITSLDRCVHERRHTRAVNVDGVGRLVEAAARRGVSPLFLSSDAVFPGKLGPSGQPRPAKESDDPGPETEYGRQKLLVEGQVLSCDGLVVRLSKTVSPYLKDGGFLEEIAVTLRRGEGVRAATDQYLALTWVEDVARALEVLVDGASSGVCHVANPEIASRHSWCLRVAAAVGAATEFLSHRARSSTSLSQSHAPRDCTLDSTRFRAELGFSFTPMEHCFEELASQFDTTSDPTTGKRQP